MWTKSYRDYPEDQPLAKEQVRSSHGIIGCEMHEINGWGNSLHIPVKRKRGFFSLLFRRKPKKH